MVWDRRAGAEGNPRASMGLTPETRVPALDSGGQGDLRGHRESIDPSGCLGAYAEVRRARRALGAAGLLWPERRAFSGTERAQRVYPARAPSNQSHRLHRRRWPTQHALEMFPY